MKSITYIKSLLGAMVILTIACSKVDSGESSFDADSMPITFSTTKSQLSATTKSSETVAQGTTDFGSYSVNCCSRESAATRVNSNGFEEDDQIGIYLYYNYWFNEYSETVILNDAALTIGSTESSLDPQRIWTFSSIGGDVPTSIHARAYYPKAAGVEFSYASMILSWEHDSTIDLLIASKDDGWWMYSDDEDATNLGALFKEYITETLGGTVYLNFEHQLATLSFYIYKASDITEELTIKSLKVNYTCAKSYYTSGTSSPWSNETITKDSYLTVSEGGTLSTLDTTETITPLTFENDIFLPPNTVINSIAFSFDGDGGEYTYTWHPHIVDMEVANYQITFELDPERNN